MLKFFHILVSQGNYIGLNLARSLVSLLFVFLAYPLELSIYRYVTIIHFLFSIIWTVLYLLPSIRSITYLGFIPLTLDTLIVTIFVMLTGHVNSFVSIGYVVIVVFSSARGDAIFGKSSVALSVVFYLTTGLLVLNGKIPIVNILGYVTAIHWKELVASSLLLLFALLSVNQIIGDLRMKTEKG